jgi:NAD(P)-dependent dehydrogenase (short-subunit alcohol dehydrogenase family)
MGWIDIDGALALVTGAGSGIGQQTAKALAGRGARVVHRPQQTPMPQRDRGNVRSVGTWKGPSTGLTSPMGPGWRRSPHRSSPAHGGVDIVVNNAGVGLISRFTSVTAADLAWIRSTNLDGVRPGRPWPYHEVYLQASISTNNDLY